MATIDNPFLYAHIGHMKVLHLFRVLAFQPHGKELERGPQARGTLVILDDDTEGRKARFVRDIDGDIMEVYISGHEVLSAVPTNKLVVLTLFNKKKHTFTAYKELPPSEVTQFTIVQTGVNPTARYDI